VVVWCVFSAPLDVARALDSPSQIDGSVVRPFRPSFSFDPSVCPVRPSRSILPCLPPVCPFRRRAPHTKTSLEYFDVAVDFFFILDIARNFNTAVVTNDDVLVLDRRTLVYGYLKGWFGPDLISSVPYKLLLNQVWPNDYVAQGKQPPGPKMFLVVVPIMMQCDVRMYDT